MKKLYDDNDVLKYSFQNSAAVTQNILLASREFDLHSTWISDFNEKKVASLLSIPDKIKIHNIVVLGQADQFFDKTVQTFAYERTFYEAWKSKKRSDKLFPIIKNEHITKVRKKISKSLETPHEKIIKRLGKTIKHFK